jgi:hypothetical protein
MKCAITRSLGFQAFDRIEMRGGNVQLCEVLVSKPSTRWKRAEEMCNYARSWYSSFQLGGGNVWRKRMEEMCNYARSWYPSLQRGGNARRKHAITQGPGYPSFRRGGNVWRKRVTKNVQLLGVSVSKLLTSRIHKTCGIPDEIGQPRKPYWVNYFEGNCQKGGPSRAEPITLQRNSHSSTSSISTLAIPPKRKSTDVSNASLNCIGAR